MCVVWNTVAPVQLNLSAGPASLQAFDTMGNAVPVVAGKDGAAIQLPAERPTYLRCGAGDYGLLEKAVANARVTYLDPVAVTSKSAEGGVEVTVTGRSRIPQDGIVDLNGRQARQRRTGRQPNTSMGWPRDKTSRSGSPYTTKRRSTRYGCVAGTGRCWRSRSRTRSNIDAHSQPRTRSTTPPGHRTSTVPTPGSRSLTICTGTRACFAAFPVSRWGRRVNRRFQA